MRVVQEKGADAALSGGVCVPRWLAMASTLEATPRQIADTPQLGSWLPGGSRVYVPYLPGAGFEQLLPACRQLVAQGLLPVPHLPARALQSRDRLRALLQALATSGVRQLMLVAGDSDRVQGPYRDTLDLLQSGLLVEQGFDQLGITGYPGGHPRIGQQKLADALHIKREYARTTGSRLWIVTQFDFDAESIGRWINCQQELDNPLPIYIGIPGPTRLHQLIGFAAQCGVGVSARLLRRRPSAARLLRTWTPDGLVRALLQHPECRKEGSIAGFHLYPFGGLRASMEWLQWLRAGPADSPGSTRSEPSLVDGVRDSC
ncbi:MAG: methylenetetrahydrofolate reductase [Sedimenticola sp.]|nr:methylenetetrahydrofolate reductase [Sedimenticola sp.]